MKKQINQILMYLTLGIGVAIIGLLLIPTGVLVILVSTVWRSIDRLVRFLEGKEKGRGRQQEAAMPEPEVTEIAAWWEKC